MALFFSRRSYNRSRKKFTDNPSEATRYVAITGTAPGGSGWEGGIISQADWLAQVQTQGGREDVLIFIHGFNTKQSDMLKRLAKIEAGLKAQGYQGAVVAFDWPSDGSVLAYKKDRADAKKVAPSLVCDGVVPLLSMVPRPRVHLLAHSMGALLTLRGCSDFGDSAGPDNAGWKADQAMFVSGDADAVWFERGAWGSLVLQERSNRFTNYYSGRDRVLALSGGIINSGRERVGHVGMPEPIAAKHWDLYCNAQYLRDVSEADQKNATYSHTWWFDNEGFYRDMVLNMAGGQADALPTRRPTNEADLALLT